jgi:hypothetical protein
VGLGEHEGAQLGGDGCGVGGRLRGLGDDAGDGPAAAVMTISSPAITDRRRRTGAIWFRRG